MFRQLVLTVVVGVSLVAVGVGAEALSMQVTATGGPRQGDNVARAAEMTPLTEEEVRRLREQGVAWTLIRQAADIVAAEGLTVDEALDRIRQDAAARSGQTGGSDDERASGDRNRGSDRGPNDADESQRIAEATNFTAFQIREFQISSGLTWADVRQVAIYASKEQISLESAAQVVELRGG